MKQYAMVHLNKGPRFSRNNEITAAEEIINEKAAEGWELLQIVSPDDLAGAMVGVFVKEK